MRKTYSKISIEMQKIIRSYYENDENTYTYPGKRDYVSTRGKDGKKNLFKRNCCYILCTICT